MGDGKGGSVKERERQLEVAEVRLKRGLGGVRVAKGKYHHRCCSFLAFYAYISQVLACYAPLRGGRAFLRE